MYSRMGQGYTTNDEPVEVGGIKLLLLVALAAIIAPLFFLVILRMSALKGMFFSSLIVIALGLTVWG